EIGFMRVPPAAAISASMRRGRPMEGGSVGPARRDLWPETLAWCSVKMAGKHAKAETIMATTRTTGSCEGIGPPADLAVPAAPLPLGDVDGAGLQVLDRPVCLQLLARGGVGRIAINAGALPVILPVRYALDEECVVLCVGVGSTLDQATRNS